MIRKEVIRGFIIFVFLVLVVLSIGFKMGSQQGMQTMCTKMNGTLAITPYSKEIVCADNSLFQGEGISNNLVNQEVFFE